MTYYVGDDVSIYPYSAVTYIEATFPNGQTYSGSGAIVGENDILTASHLIYSPSDGGLAEDVDVFPGLDGFGTSSDSYDAEYFNYFEVDQDGDGLLSRFDSEDDLAILGCNTYLTDESETFQIDPYGSSGYYRLTGYPGLYADASGPRMTNDYGYVKDNSYSDVFDYRTIESYPGSSGGPLWYLEEGEASIVGVASTSGWAVDVSAHYSTILDWIDGNDFLLTEPFSAQDDSVTIDEDTSVSIAVLENDQGINADELTLSINSQATNGSASVEDNAYISYTPEEDFYGFDSLTYQIQNSSGQSDTATVEINIASVNDAPNAVSDTASTNVNRAVTINVLNNDNDPEGDNLTITSLGEPNHGQITTTDSSQIIYRPDKGYSGTDSFVYTVSDNQGGFDTTEVVVNVEPNNETKDLIILILGHHSSIDIDNTDANLVILGDQDDERVNLGSNFNGDVIINLGLGSNTVNLTGNMSDFTTSSHKNLAILTDADGNKVKISTRSINKASMTLEFDNGAIDIGMIDVNDDDELDGPGFINAEGKTELFDNLEPEDLVDDNSEELSIIVHDTEKSHNYETSKLLIEDTINSLNINDTNSNLSNLELMGINTPKNDNSETINLFGTEYL